MMAFGGSFEFFVPILLAIIAPAIIALLLVKERHRRTVLRITGAVLTVFAFWIGALVTSTGGCGVGFLGILFGPIVAGVAIAISVCLPRTRLVDYTLLALFILAPFAGALAGAGAHDTVSSCP